MICLFDISVLCLATIHAIVTKQMTEKGTAMYEKIVPRATTNPRDF